MLTRRFWRRSSSCFFLIENEIDSMTISNQELVSNSFIKRPWILFPVHFYSLQQEFLSRQFLPTYSCTKYQNHSKVKMMKIPFLIRRRRLQNYRFEYKFLSILVNLLCSRVNKTSWCKIENVYLWPDPFCREGLNKY